jgi:hypothetical protein
VLSPAAGRRPRHAGISPRSSPPIRWAACSPGFGAGRDAQLQRRLPPCVYDERPRLPVGLAVGAADQAPRACDSARGLTGKESAISRFVAPGPRVRILLPPAVSHVRTWNTSLWLPTTTDFRRNALPQSINRQTMALLAPGIRGMSVTAYFLHRKRPFSRGLPRRQFVIVDATRSGNASESGESATNHRSR